MEMFFLEKQMCCFMRIHAFRSVCAICTKLHPAPLKRDLLSHDIQAGITTIIAYFLKNRFVG